MDDQKHSFYLPPGFRFHPTDDEIITHYLAKKITDHNFCTLAVGLANFNDCEPWDLPGKAKMGDKEWYFFCQKDRKYPTGMRTNRATRAGYWKTTGKDKEIFKGKGVLIGKKKTLVFYMGRAPRGHRTNWVMHEYRLEGRQEEWVVCKLYHKTKDTKISPLQTLESKKNSFVNNMFVANPNPPPILNSPSFNSTNPGAVIRPQELEDKSSLGFSFGPNWFLRHEEERLRAANSIASTSHDTGLSTERNVEASSSPISILAGAGYGF